MFVEIELLSTFLTICDTLMQHRGTKLLVLFIFCFHKTGNSGTWGMWGEQEVLHFNVMKLICKVEILVIISCKIGDTNMHEHRLCC